MTPFEYGLLVSMLNFCGIHKSPYCVFDGSQFLQQLNHEFISLLWVKYPFSDMGIGAFFSVDASWYWRSLTGGIILVRKWSKNGDCLATKRAWNGTVAGAKWVRLTSRFQFFHPQPRRDPSTFSPIGSTCKSWRLCQAFWASPAQHCAEIKAP